MSITASHLYPPLVSLSSRTRSHGLATLQLQLVVDSVTMFRMEVAVVDACALKGWSVLFTRTLKRRRAHKGRAERSAVSAACQSRCRTVSSTSHLMIAHHSITHLLLFSRALTKRSSLHGEEYLAGENTVVEEHRASQGPHARPG